MDKDREIMHRILDGEAGDEEKRVAANGMADHSGLREEFGGLAHAVRMLEESERRTPPVSFTADVMKELSPARPSVPDRVREFFFGSRVLRWNMATAMAAALIVVASIAMAPMLFRGAERRAAGPVGQEAAVRLTFYAPQARSVSVAGDFNKWMTDADRMDGSNGMWSIELKLKPGVYAYSFVVDGKAWVADPGAETFQEDGFGARNAVMRVAI